MHGVGNGGISGVAAVAARRRMRRATVSMDLEIWRGRGMCKEWNGKMANNRGKETFGHGHANHLRGAGRCRVGKAGQH